MFFQALLLSAALEAGLLSGGVYNYGNYNAKMGMIDAMYTTLSATASLGPAYAGGAMECYFTPLALTAFKPFQMTFIFNAGLDFGNLKIGYEHSCFHPMNPYATIFDNEIKPKYEGGYDKFFVRIETDKRGRK